MRMFSICGLIVLLCWWVQGISPCFHMPWVSICLSTIPSWCCRLGSQSQGIQTTAAWSCLRARGAAPRQSELCSPPLHIRNAWPFTHWRARPQIVGKCLWPATAPAPGGSGDGLWGSAIRPQSPKELQEPGCLPRVSHPESDPKLCQPKGASQLQRCEWGEDQCMPALQMSCPYVLILHNCVCRWPCK